MGMILKQNQLKQKYDNFKNLNGFRPENVQK